MPTEIRNDTENDKYVIEIDGTEAGFAAYHIRSGPLYFFYHTVVHDEFGGKGTGSQLARGALDDVRANGGSIVPLCPFIAAWLKRHPEYDDMVDHEIWERVSKKSDDG